MTNCEFTVSGAKSNKFKIGVKMQNNTLKILKILNLSLTIMILTSCNNYKNSQSPSQSRTNKILISKKINIASSSDAYLELAKTQLNLKQWQRAKKNLLKAKELSKKHSNPEIYSYLGYYSQQVGDLQEAENYYKKALIISPHNTEIKNQYGVY